MAGACWAYVGPMLGSWGPCWGLFEPAGEDGMLISSRPPAWIATSMAMLGLCGTYVGPMLEHVVLLRAMLVPF
jgi:hypothetical protein